MQELASLQLLLDQSFVHASQMHDAATLALLEEKAVPIDEGRKRGRGW
jgi:hypothetical protein